MYYKVDMNGKYVGQIWREFPDELPDDWTIGVEMEVGNSIMPLPDALAYISNAYPGVILTQIEEVGDVKCGICGSKQIRRRNDVGWDVYPGGEEQQHREFCRNCGAERTVADRTIFNENGSSTSDTIYSEWANYKPHSIERWNKTIQKTVKSPEVDAFLNDIITVCRKHGMSIGHEDEEGAFIVKLKRDDSDFTWLLDAYMES